MTRKELKDLIKKIDRCIKMKENNEKPEFIYIYENKEVIAKFRTVKEASEFLGKSLVTVYRYVDGTRKHEKYDIVKNKN